MAENHSTNDLAAVANELYIVVAKMLGLGPLLRGLADENDDIAAQLSLLAGAADGFTGDINAIADRLEKMGWEQKRENSDLVTA